MDTASTLMGLGLLILFIAPVGYILYDQSLKEKKRAKRLAFLALKQGYTIDETANINGLSLALDKKAGKFLLLKSGGDAKLQEVDLHSVSRIELAKVDEDGHSTGVLDEMREISLQLKTKENTAKKVIFYAEEEDPVTQKIERLENAIKWQKILQQSIK